MRRFPLSAGRPNVRLFGMAMGLISVLFVCVTLVSCGGSSGQATNTTKPLFEALQDVGYEGGEASWYDSLDNEQRAAIDLAFEAERDAGFQGNEEEWISSRLTIAQDSQGRYVVALPDGAEFVVSADVMGTDGGAAAVASDAPVDSSVGTESTRAISPAMGGDSLGAALVVAEVRVEQGVGEIAVPVMIERNPGILGMTVSISYDEDAMTLNRVENGEAFRALSMTRSRSLSSGCLITWDGVELAQEDVLDGTALTLFFQMTDGAEPGVYPVVVRSGGSAFDQNLVEVGVACQDGGIVLL